MILKIEADSPPGSPLWLTQNKNVLATFFPAQTVCHFLLAMEKLWKIKFFLTKSVLKSVSVVEGSYNARMKSVCLLLKFFQFSFNDWVIFVVPFMKCTEYIFFNRIFSDQIVKISSRCRWVKLSHKALS